MATDIKHPFDNGNMAYIDKRGWVLGSDGMPEDPNADPDCKTCMGHGVVSYPVGFWDALTNCPACCPNSKQ